LHAPQSITDLDSLRIACILKVELPVPEDLLVNETSNLARVWMAAIGK
jgi:hypothetical protein